MTQKILRLPAVLDQSGLSRSTIYLQIKQGLWTKPIPLGFRAAGWPSDEVAAIIAARISGCPNSEIYALVVSLHEARKTGAK